MMNVGVHGQASLFAVPARAIRALEARVHPDPGGQVPLWHEPEDVHMTQRASELVPDGHGMKSQNCAAVSAVMALRLVGMEVPGFDGQRTQQATDAMRILMTGANDASRAINPRRVQEALTKLGARAELVDGKASLEAARTGKVVIFGGNTASHGSWYSTFRGPVDTKGGGHAVVVSRYYPDSDLYAVNDPNSEGVIYATHHQLREFSIDTSIVVEGPGEAVRPATVRNARRAEDDPEPVDVDGRRADAD